MCMADTWWRAGEPSTSSLLLSGKVPDLKGLVSGEAFSSLGPCCGIGVGVAGDSCAAKLESTAFLCSLRSWHPLTGWCICGLACVTPLFWQNEAEKAKHTPWSVFIATPKLEKCICSLPAAEFGQKKWFRSCPCSHKLGNFLFSCLLNQQLFFHNAPFPGLVIKTEIAFLFN